eukprot:TRINITY_DN4509_c0_g2_i1.p1 TRINITY_DN4509_c0_g2~~TRINITY_DN4509_c0_g2_i1.p1  ORF type:complete len:315 (-),score=52.39 TRINITY_DN4509_c0_g2_i1:211-1155(-)
MSKSAAVTSTRGCSMLTMWFGCLVNFQISSPLKFYVQLSHDLSLSTWICIGNQAEMIAPMECFFFSLSSTEQELDFLHMIGSHLRASKLGCYLRISKNGALDGGWVLLTNKNVNDCVCATGPSSSTCLSPPSFSFTGQSFISWCQANNQQVCHMISRDLAAHGPHETEFCIPISSQPSSSVEEYSDLAFEAFVSASNQFKFPLPSDNFVSLRQFFIRHGGNNFKIHVTVCSDQFSKLGVSFLVPETSEFYEGFEQISKLFVTDNPVETEKLKSFQGTMTGTTQVEVSVNYLHTEYSYNVFSPRWNLFLAWSNYF